MASLRPSLRVVTGEAIAKPTLDEVFRAHSRYVATVAHRALGRSHEVEDLVQDVFVAAQRGLEALREPDAIRGWLATVTVRKARRRLRRRRLEIFLRLDEAPSYLEVLDPAASPSDRTLLAQVYRLLDRLPVEQRLGWTLHHVEGETLERVATLCECSLATIKRRIRAAQMALDEAFDE